MADKKKLLGQNILPLPPNNSSYIMINRRNIRVKAMQVIYGFELAEITPTAQDIEKAINTKFSKTGQLLYYLTQLTIDVAKYVEIYSNKRASKHITTAADLSVNTKIAGNDVIWGLMENKSYELAIKNNNTELIIDGELVKKLFLKLEASEIYKAYINNNSRNMAEDVEIMKYIFNDLIIADEDVEASTIELFQNYDDDIEMIHSIVLQSLESPKKTNFVRLVSPDKNDYAKRIVAAVYDKDEAIMEYIIPKLKNWDAERVAKLDMIIIKMGISELLYFETIPVKVTINEYIDIAKDYSTPQSGQFVNGILDNIHKDLVKAEKLYKVDFRKM